MANVVYRDVAASDGHTVIYEILSKAVLNGWTTVASSDGTTRTTSAPGSASTLNNTNAWWLIQHTGSGRKLGMQRKADSNTFTIQVTPGSRSLTTGNATTMDSNATYTKTIRSDAQCYPTASTTTTKIHIVVSDSSCGLHVNLRRSPYVGSNDCCFILHIEEFTDLTWSSNPDPCAYIAIWRDDNIASSYMFAAGGGTSIWYKMGLAGEAWGTLTQFENPGSICGSGTAAPSGVDQLVELRWVDVYKVVVWGKSNLIRGLQPYRAPTVGIDSGGTLNWAAMGWFAVPNDGVALTS